MAEGWDRRIEEAQQLLTYTIGGERYPRIPYGKEGPDWASAEYPCHDCAVVRGELHVPGCDVERCPRCRRQAISCDCSTEQ